MSTGSEARFAAISTVMQRQPVKIELNGENGRPQKISDYFGINTFADAFLEKFSGDSLGETHSNVDGYLKAIASRQPAEVAD